MQFPIISLVFVLVVVQGGAQEEQPNSENKNECVKMFLDWCMSEKYPTQSSGISIMSSGGPFQSSGSSFVSSGENILVSNVQGNGYISCTISSKGTECFKNQSPWYQCFPNGTLNYKGKKLDGNSVNDEVCEAKNHAAQFRAQMEFNRSQFKEGMKTFQKGMQNFSDRMSNFNNQMKTFQNRLFSNNFPWGGNRS